MALLRLIAQDGATCWWEGDMQIRMVRNNYRSLHMHEEMYAGEDSIVRYWLKPPFRIDGWRLDVANMLAWRYSCTHAGSSSRA